MIAILLRLYPHARANGLGPMLGALALVVAQAAMQTIAVFSLIPLLSAAADMAAFRVSRGGRMFVDLIGGGSDRHVLIWAGSISLGVLLMGNVVALAAEYFRGRFAHRIGHQMRVRLVRELLARRYEYFTGINSSTLLKIVVDDAGLLGGQLISPVLEVLARILLILLLVGLVVAVEPLLVVGGAVLIAFYYLTVMRPIRRWAERSSDRIMFASRAVYFEINQLLTGIKPAIAADRQAYFTARAEAASRAFSEEVPVVPMYWGIPRSVLELLVFGGMIAWLLIVLVSGGDLTALLPRIGLVALVAYRLMPSLQSLFALIGSISSSRQAFDEVMGILAEQPRFAASTTPPAEGVHAQPLIWSHEIRFENVGFTYANAAEPAISGVSLTIAKGQHVAFVGPTGSGKSTLIDLVLGLLQPTTGRILIDGEPLTPKHLPSWRRVVGYVPQDLFLLDGTIAENIAFGWDGHALDRARVTEVAELAQAREFIEDGRADGFDARVGERGMRLSGGQRQRLALARALYARPNILVMDEATSALDPETERQVVAALASAHEALTVITVTHRMSTVRNYDCIHYVENGRVVASGDFEGLSEKHADFRVQAH